MNITYYTVASTRCMGIWRDEDIIVPTAEHFVPPMECFNGFETRDAAEAFIRSYPTILERESKHVRNAKITQMSDDKFILSYEAECGWGENRHWKETAFYLKVNEYNFSLVPGSQDVLTLTLK